MPRISLKKGATDLEWVSHDDANTELNRTLTESEWKTNPSVILSNGGAGVYPIDITTCSTGVYGLTASANVLYVYVYGSQIYMTSALPSAGIVGEYYKIEMTSTTSSSVGVVAIGSRRDGIDGLLFMNGSTTSGAAFTVECFRQDGVSDNYACSMYAATSRTAPRTYSQLTGIGPYSLTGYRQVALIGSAMRFSRYSNLQPGATYYTNSSGISPLSDGNPDEISFTVPADFVAGDIDLVVFRPLIGRCVMLCALGLTNASKTFAAPSCASPANFLHAAAGSSGAALTFSTSAGSGGGYYHSEITVLQVY